jgi:dTDP-3-amino-3,4,6-trideoxy-alpha-D-glucose transaminase
VAVPQINLQPILQATAKAWRASLDRVIRRGQFILGEELRLFEEEFAAAMGAKYAIGVASGTAAIELSLRELSTREGVTGDVLTSALTAPFTAVAIRAAGYRARFCDVDPETLQIDARHAAARVTKRTRAIVPVHLYGQPCDLGAVRKIGLPVIQDACQAHGARYRNRPLAAFSTHVAYSFYPTKNLGCLGDGGCILTNSLATARRLRSMRDGGRRGDQVSHIAGINARLDEIQCCFLRAFLPHLKAWNAHRARIAAIYDEELAGCDGVRLVRRTAESVNHLYVIRTDSERSRDKLRKYLAKHGIGSAIHYPVPLHKHPAFAERISLPNAERAAREILSLPLWAYMKESAARRVAAQIRAFYR